MSTPNHTEGPLTDDKYRIQKRDEDGNWQDVPEDASYFVLRYDKDPYALLAAAVYSAVVSASNPALGSQLFDRVEEICESSTAMHMQARMAESNLTGGIGLPYVSDPETKIGDAFDLVDRANEFFAEREEAPGDGWLEDYFNLHDEHMVLVYSEYPGPHWIPPRDLQHYDEDDVIREINAPTD